MTGGDGVIYLSVELVRLGVPMSTVTESRSRGGRALTRRGLLAVALSVVANAITLAGAQALRIAPEFRALSWSPIIFLTVLGAVGAVVAYWLLRRWTDDPDRTFTLVAGVVLVLSFVPDLLLLAFDEAATVLGVVVLMVLHVAVAAVCVAVLTGTTATETNPEVGGT